MSELIKILDTDNFIINYDRECDIYRVYTFKDGHFKGVKESMQEIEVYINPEDIINKLSEKDKQIEGSITISCILTNQQGIDGQYRYHLGQDEINLMG